jgi:hypothetical protein
MYCNLLWIKSFSASMGDDVCNGLSMGGGSITSSSSSGGSIVRITLRESHNDDAMIESRVVVAA